MTPSTPAQRATAYAVHCVTASGVLFAALAAMELTNPVVDSRLVFIYLLAATAVDAIDGPLARAAHVKRHAPEIDGRAIDDILDYLTFAFIPLLLVWRMDWLPPGTGVCVTLAMVASLFGFSHQMAKDEANGLFRGFPSYWNIYAFYAGAMVPYWGQWANLLLLLTLTVATVAPVWVIYPNLAPPRHRGWILAGAGVWTLLLVAMLRWYPDVPGWLLAISAIYPIAYTIVSLIYARRVARL